MIGFFQRYVLHNFGLKVLSLLLATGLWFLISPDEQPAEVAVRAPIVFQHVPSQLEISSEAIPEAQIRVRGPERVIRQLQANEIHAEIELADVKPGDRTFDLAAGAPSARRHCRAGRTQPVASRLRYPHDPRGRDSSASDRRFCRQRSHMQDRSAPRHHHRPPPSCGEDRFGHNRSHRRHRNPWQRRLHNQRLRGRPPGASRADHIDSRNRPRAESGKHFRTLNHRGRAALSGPRKLRGIRRALALEGRCFVRAASLFPANPLLRPALIYHLSSSSFETFL
jgi:hypothetical protein